MTTSTKPMFAKTLDAADDSQETDPVCGMAVPRSAAPADAYCEGQHFFFCSSGCKQAFEQEPARYLEPVVETN
ncbi:MAG: YHS domain-containing protein [Deltaproteobacteria bacterium]|nr:YHS domain-containing protein [Deltaproteobacteria bacterium]